MPADMGCISAPSFASAAGGMSMNTTEAENTSNMESTFCCQRQQQAAQSASARMNASRNTSRP